MTRIKSNQSKDLVENNQAPTESNQEPRIGTDCREEKREIRCCKATFGFLRPTELTTSWLTGAYTPRSLPHGTPCIIVFITGSSA